jgi:DNA-binding NarL/FixJ family response regulator
LAAGAHAYLGKHSSSSALLNAIRQLHAGRGLSTSEQATDIATDSDELSAREREVMQMVVQGQTSRQMAETLGISKSSVDTYRARVFRKLRVEDRAALFARLAATGPHEEGS